jgi:hypothetical protein
MKISAHAPVHRWYHVLKSNRACIASISLPSPTQNFGQADTCVTARAVAACLCCRFQGHAPYLVATNRKQGTLQEATGGTAESTHTLMACSFSWLIISPNHHSKSSTGQNHRGSQ